jgi:hypothetical protein
MMPPNVPLAVSGGTQDLRQLVQIEPESLRREVLHAVSSAISASGMDSWE